MLVCAIYIARPTKTFKRVIIGEFSHPQIHYNQFFTVYKGFGGDLLKECKSCAFAFFSLCHAFTYLKQKAGLIDISVFSGEPACSRSGESTTFALRFFSLGVWNCIAGGLKSPAIRLFCFRNSGWCQ